MANKKVPEGYYKEAAADNRYIVGSISDDGTTVSFSTSPVIHYTPQAARAEAERLARLNPGKRFAPAQLLGSVMIGGVTWN